MKAGGPGDCDAYEVGDGCIIEHEGRWSKLPGDGSPTFIPDRELSGWREEGMMECKDPSIIYQVGRYHMYYPEFPISSCLDPSDAPPSTRAIVVLLTNAVNHPNVRVVLAQANRHQALLLPVGPNQAHKTIRRRRELAFSGQLEVTFTTFALPPSSSKHAPLPGLPLFTSDDLKDIRYPGAGWSPAIRSNSCRNTSRDTATSAS